MTRRMTYRSHMTRSHRRARSFLKSRPCCRINIKKSAHKQNRTKLWLTWKH